MEEKEIVETVEETTPVEVPKKKKVTKKEVVEETTEQAQEPEPIEETEQVENKPTHEENLEALNTYAQIDKTMQEIVQAPKAPNDLNIGEAMKELRNGKYLSRRAWALNKYIKHHWHDSFVDNLPEGAIVDHTGFSFLLSHTDILSCDWYVVA